MPISSHALAIAVSLALTCLPAAAGDPAGADRAAPLSLTSLLAQESSAVKVSQPAPSKTEPQKPPFAAYPLYPSLTHKFELKIGGALYSDFNTSLQVNSEVGLGADVNLENLLGLDQSASIWRADMSYAFTPRHEVIASYYDIARSGTKTLPEDIAVGEVVLPAGASVGTDFSTTILKVAYLYNFVTDNRTKIGASIGLYNMLIDTSFATSTNTVDESFKAIAPLPVIGLHGKYALSRRWNMLASIEVFQVDIDMANGLLADSILAIENDLFDHVGWGVALNAFKMDASVEGNGPLTADINYDYQGVLLYLRTYF